MRVRGYTLAVLGLGVVIGCSRAETAAPSTAVAPNFVLVCDSSDTKDQSTLFCMRMDTRNGDVRRVDLAKIPRSSGPTQVAAGPPDTYQLVCDSTDTDESSDFRCIRLNRATGDLMLIALPKLGVIPETR